MRLVDLAGRRFGELLVVERGETRKRVTYWTCRCDCGALVDVDTGALRRGKRTTCGHVAPELAATCRTWPRDPRILVGEDGTVYGVQGRPLTASLNRTGYPVVGVLGGGWGHAHPVHLIVCEAWHGLSPGPEYEAAHRNGVPADCRPANLRWITTAENAADRITHGTQTRGETHGCHRLTDAAVLAIRAAPASTTDRALAAVHGVHRATVTLARTGRTWKHI